MKEKLMKEKYLINGRIIDPKNKIDEILYKIKNT